MRSGFFANNAFLHLSPAFCNKKSRHRVAAMPARQQALTDSQPTLARQNRTASATSPRSGFMPRISPT